ncbi:MAG: hypothetical protein A3F13_04090 [Gammaproteobacteria bacterium RIFCSPHIGHO2_12_FULL_40_19]|nr:MAG: hypothetical protein A3F13_04090 [Gammaproteobacteria bacterium RIFCSPHIGHO2_12_FULL_40_19]
MKKLFFIFIILLVAIGLGFLIHKDPGYVIVSYQNWVISTSIWVGAITVIIAFFILYFVIRIFKNIFSIPKMLRRRKLFRDAQKYQKYMNQGIADMVVGDFKSAEKYLIKVTQLNNAYVNFLLLAQAAQAQNAIDRRDHYLQQAFQFGQDATFAISLTQAQFFMKSDQWDAALIIFKSLHQQDPKNPLILSALKIIYLKTHEWEPLKLLIPQLKRQKLISAEELNQINPAVPR